VRLFQQPIETHPFILAAKQPRLAGRRAAHRASIEVRSLAPAASAGAHVVAVVTVENVGGAVWLAVGRVGHGPVRLGVQLLDGSGRIVSKDFARAELPADVLPGRSSTIRFEFAVPRPGRYRLKFDMVAEGVTWFEQTGSPVQVRTLDVNP